MRANACRMNPNPTIADIGCIFHTCTGALNVELAEDDERSSAHSYLMRSARGRTSISGHVPTHKRMALWTRDIMAIQIAEIVTVNIIAVRLMGLSGASALHRNHTCFLHLLCSMEAWITRTAVPGHPKHS